MSRTPGTPIECGYGAFCEAVGDCPTHISQAPDEWKLVGCKAEEWAEFFPPGTKSCIYR